MEPEAFALTEPSPGKPSRMSHEAAKSVAVVLLGELCAARRRVNPQSRKLRADGNLVELVGRLREGVPAEDLRHVIAVMEARARVDDFWADQFDAITPFRKGNIGKHLGMTVEQAGRRANGERAPPPVSRNPVHAPADLTEIQKRKREFFPEEADSRAKSSGSTS